MGLKIRPCERRILRLLIEREAFRLRARQQILAEDTGPLQTHWLNQPPKHLGSRSRCIVKSDPRFRGRRANDECDIYSAWSIGKRGDLKKQGSASSRPDFGIAAN